MQDENGPGHTEVRKEAPRAPSASYSITMRVRIDNKVGMIGEVISAIGRADGDVGAIDIVQATGAHVIRDITVDAASVECRAREINEEMKVAAAHAIAEIITPEELNPDYIVPSVFNREVVKLVAAAVTQAAIDTGVAGRQRPAAGKDRQ